jgi:monoamine oxidase
MAIECQADVVYTVVVVGAGAAGLQAVNTLLGHPAYQEGRMNVVLLEARDRVGGRISIDRKWGVPFDLGRPRLFGVVDT